MTIHGLVLLSAALAAEPTFDLAGEIEWARSQWPELRTVNLQSPLPRLIRWSPPEHWIKVYIFTPEHECLGAEMVQIGDGAFRGDVPFKKTGMLAREDTVSAGNLLARVGAWSYEKERVYGALSYVDSRVARFGGEPLVMRLACDGPSEWLPCEGGGERPCDSCQRLRFELSAEAETPKAAGGDSSEKRPVTCYASCPPAGSSDVRQRFRVFEAHVTAWRETKAPLSEIPAVYRSRNECLRVHFPGRARRR